MLPPYIKTFIVKFPEPEFVMTVSSLFHEKTTSLDSEPYLSTTVSDSVLPALNNTNTVFVVFEQHTILPLMKEADSPGVKAVAIGTPRTLN